MANREYQRRRRSHLASVNAPPPADSTPEASAPSGAVVAAVEAQLADLPAAQDRPGLAAIAVRLAEVLDRPDAVPQHAAAAHRLVEVLSTLTASSIRRTRLTAVRSLTQRGTDSMLP